MYAANVRVAHVGLFDKRLVFGTVTFGYTGEPIEGQLTKRKKPRCLLAIDPAALEWVKKIFQWYVEDRLPIDEIVRRLNDNPEIPLPPRCTTDAWTHDSVVGVLRNSRYRGWWKYGATETVWVSSKDYARQMPRLEPLQEGQIEELRIIAEVQWYAAQQR